MNKLSLGHGETLSLRDKTWAEFSTLGVALFDYDVQISFVAKQPNLTLKP
jgi:hypothetical protein